MIADMVLQVAKTSLTVSMLIAALLLFVPLLQKRYPAKWRYIAWLVIAVRLLVPMSFSLPEAPIRLSVPEQKTLATVTPPSNERPYLQMDILSHANTSAAWDFEDTPGISSESVKPAIIVTPLEIIGSVWLLGAVMFLLLQIGAYQLFLLKLRKSATSEVPQFVKETVWQIGVDMGVCKLPETIITDTVEAPVLTGIIRLRLLLPHVNYTEYELSFILRHELVHYRRRDMWYKLLLMLANALHWFNPLVYLMVAQAGKDVELACDDDVTRELGKDERARYGDTILAALPQKRKMEPMFSTHFGSTKKDVKGRLHNLFDMTLKRRGIAALCAVVVCAVAITGIVTFGYAATGSDSIPVNTDSVPYSFSVPSIEAGEVVCIGKVELGPDISYSGTLFIGSGGGSMMALHESPDITRHDGIEWSHYFSGGSQINFSSEKSASRYVYVGCKPDGIRLTDVSGKLIPHESGSSHAFPGTSPLTQTSIFARARDGTWASATEIEGNSYQAQLDGKLRWLDAVYAEYKTPFIISETIPENESFYIAGIGYLYNTSEVYRTMSQMKNGSFQLSDGSSFSRSGLPSSKVYDRTAVMVDSDADLQIDAEYSLKEGKMTIWLVDPSGKRVYWGDMAKAYNESFTVGGAKGLWSVITVSESENGAVSGTSRMALRQSAQTQAAAVKDTADAVITLTGGNNITTKSIEAGEVTCIGKIELGPDSAYTATLSVESGSGAMIALHDSPNITRHAGTGWNLHYGPGSSLYFSSEQPKIAYVYVGSMPDGTKLTNVTVRLVQSKSPVSPEGAPNFQIKSNGESLLHSGSFEAKAGQTLTITATSNIKGGTVDFFLFSPAGNGLNKQTDFTFGGSNATETVELSAGRWAYNCTGFFDSGDIEISGTVRDTASVGAQISQSSKSDTEKYDEEGIRIMDNSGTWGESINRLLPNMSPVGVEKVVDIYLERHLFPGITTSQGARQVAATIEPALKYMTKDAIKAANSRISAYYNN